MAERKVTIAIDPTMQIEKHAIFREKQSGWEVYRAVYWGIYVFILGVLLLTAFPAATDFMSFFGWSLVLLALFVIVYGFVLSLHLKLMKKHA
jgi:hypothetical protein